MNFFLLTLFLFLPLNLLHAQTMESVSNNYNDNPIGNVTIYTTDITSESATLNATLYANATSFDSVTILYALRSELNPAPQSIGRHAIEIIQNQSLKAKPFKVLSLIPNTEYNFNIVFHVGEKSWYSNTVYFKTLNTNHESSQQEDSIILDDQKKSEDSIISLSHSPIINHTAVVNISSNSATLQGIVNPNGSDCYASFQTLTGGPFGHQFVGDSMDFITLKEYELTNLTPLTNYQFKIFASNRYGNTVGSWVYFTTLQDKNNSFEIDSLNNNSNDFQDTLRFLNKNSELDSITLILNKLYLDKVSSLPEVNRYIKNNTKLRKKGIRLTARVQELTNKIELYSPKLNINITDVNIMNKQLSEIEKLNYHLGLNQLKSIHTLNYNFNLALKILVNQRKPVAYKELSKKVMSLKLNISLLCAHLNKDCISLNKIMNINTYNNSIIISTQLLRCFLNSIIDSNLQSNSEKIVVKVEALDYVSNNSVINMNGLTVNYFFADLIKVVDKDIKQFVMVTSPSYDFVDPGNYSFYLTNDYGPKKINKSIKKGVDLTVKIETEDQPYLVQIPVFK